MRLSTIDYKKEVDTFLRYLREGTPAIFFDLETTGFSATLDRILSCSAIKVQYQNGVLTEIDRLNLFLNPGFPIPPVVTKIHGIDDARVKNEPREEQAIGRVLAFFGQYPLVAGYNSISFDQRFMPAMYERAWGDDFTPFFHLDVYKMAKEKVSTKKHTLSHVAKELGCDIGLRFHSSLDDVIATLRLFETLVPHYMGAPEQTPVTQHAVRVIEARHWTQSHRLNRLYIRTDPYTKSYYDIYKKEWRSDNEAVNLSLLRQQVLTKYGVGAENELVRMLTRT